MKGDIKMEILIANKDPAMWELYSRILKRDSNYTILTARNKTEVLKLFNIHDISATVIDFGMPNALETIMEINSKPVIAIGEFPEQEATAKGYGADYFVAFRHIDDLTKAVRRATQPQLEKV